MKKYLSFFISALLLSLSTANAQYVTIPDSAFRSQLKLKYPGCFNAANQMDTTCTAIVTEDSIGIGANGFMGTDINGDSIKSLEGLQYFKNLIGLQIVVPKLKRLPSFATTIKTLLIDYFRLSDSMPALPPSLITLSCYYCNFSKLPPLPLTLKWFDCQGNVLTSLPALPPSLTFLTCNQNHLTVLPPLPDSLRTFDCSSNNFTSLPQLPDSLLKIDCDNNPVLTTMPDLPSKLTSLKVYSTSIKCLPVLPASLTSLWVDTSVIHCIPNTNPGMSIVHYYYGGNSSSVVISPRLCNVTNNVNNCKAFPVVLGVTFYDLNNNNVKDANEPYKINSKIQLSNGGYSFTDRHGYYEGGTTTLGSLTLTPVNDNHFFTAFPAIATFNFNSYDTSVTQDFAYHLTTIKDSLSIAVTSFTWANPGFTLDYQIDFQNVGSTNLNATVVKVMYDSSLTVFNSASNPAVTNTGNTLTLNLASLPFGSFNSFNAYFKVKTTAALGDTVLTIASIAGGTAVAMDTSNNVIVSSHDPNIKLATEKLTTGQISSGKYIDYTIRYQNTGTAKAVNVVVTDTLPAQLLANTLEVISTSHNTNTTVKGNTVSFEMRNIMLSDSNTNEAASHGFIRFKVKPVNTLVAGNVVSNKASIYFDYNKPVVTNTAVTQIISQTFPLKLISFKGNKTSENNIKLDWTTANEMNTRLFLIEQSLNGREFAAIGNVKANGSGNNSYDYNVTNPAKTNLYFRLKMTDKDGAFSYSPIVLIKNKTGNAGFTLLQNPAQHTLVLTSVAASLFNTEALLVNSVGVVVKRAVFHLVTQTIDVNDLPPGVYYLKTVEGNEKVVVAQ